MCMSKGPEFDNVSCPARFPREIAHESGGDLTVSVSGVDNLFPRKWTIMCKYHDLSLRLRLCDGFNFSIQLFQVGKVCFSMRLHRPVFGMLEIIQAKADMVHLRISDVRE